MRYLAFAPLAYALDILRPLQAEARLRGDGFCWWTTPELRQQLTDDENTMSRNSEVTRYAPDAVFSPVDWVPYWFPGKKVMTFHGFDTRKRTDINLHFRIRGWYDLFLTQGPSTTPRFQELAEEHGYFEVRETGWAKLDPLFSADPAPLSRPKNKPAVIYASTFSSNTCSIPILAPEIEHLLERTDWHWFLTTHPKTDNRHRKRLQDIANRFDNARYVPSYSLIPMLKAGDVMVCDTSSIIFEFILQQRPAVTFRNPLAAKHLIDIQHPGQLEDAIRQALSYPPDLMQAITDYGNHLHPYRDGRSAARCLDAVENHVRSFRPRTRKPLNLVRKWKLRWRMRKLSL